jgi:glycerol-3-phosphate dehydrogenase
VEFILETASDYLSRRPTRADILSVFTGIRPLVQADRASGTAALSRDHHINISKSGLLTVIGGKWTTGKWPKIASTTPSCWPALKNDLRTRELPIHGSAEIYRRVAGWPDMGAMPRSSRR